MKVREIIVYEIEYRLRSPSTWLYAAILFGLPFIRSDNIVAVTAGS